MNTQAIKTITELEQALKGESSRLVKVGTTWCGPCKQMESTLKAFEAEESEKIIRLDADVSPELVSTLGVRGVPTILKLSEDMKIVKTHTGGITTAQLQEFK